MRYVVRRLFPLFALILPAVAAQGQRYRVIVGIAGTQRMSIIEFSPCIPAETSACGAWVNGVIDTSRDSSYGTIPAASTEQQSSDRVVTISIQNGSLNIRTVVPGRGAGERVIADPRRSAIAVAISGDSRYAFAVLAAKTAGEQAIVEMIDFASKSVIASIRVPDRPAGIAMAP